MVKTVEKFGDIKIEKQTFHQQKRPFWINNIDINKIVLSNEVSLGKRGFKYFVGYKDVKKSYNYACFFQKLVHIEETLMKPDKNNELLEKYNEIWKKKLKIVLKKKLIVNMYTMKISKISIS